MKALFFVTLALVLIVLGVMRTLAVEEAAFRLIRKEGKIEIRQYEAHLLAEVLIESRMEEAGNQAFRLLFEYISGKNRSRQSIAMTAPVSQSVAGEKIAMTTPVGQRQDGERWAVSFMMPAVYTLQTIPTPLDERVSIREVPAGVMAAIRYSGRWSEENYRSQLETLETWLKQNRYAVQGPPVWARYDPPMMPAFLRRNEILIPVAAD